jgi:hypothetical protein
VKVGVLMLITDSLLFVDLVGEVDGLVEALQRCQGVRRLLALDRPRRPHLARVVGLSGRGRDGSQPAAKQSRCLGAG